MVNVKIVQGKNEVGGNCIRIEDKDRVLIFDQGVRFSVFTKYFSRYVEPLGIPELRQLGVIPSQRVYKDAEAIYITHFHLDHLGFLQNVPVRSIVRVPSEKLFRLTEKWYRFAISWLKYVPPRYAVIIEEVSPLKSDKNDVLPIPVEHSAYPSYAYLYFGSDEHVLYTGDFRVTSIVGDEFKRELYGSTLMEYLEENPDIKIDHLVIEGTNFGRITTPLTGESAKSILSNLIKPDETVFIAMHPQEFTLATLTIHELHKHNKDVVVISNRLIEILELWSKAMPRMSKEFKHVSVLADVIEGATIFNMISVNDIQTEPNRYAIITDLWHLIDTLRLFEPGTIPLGSPTILMTSEPFEEEAVHDEALILRWLGRYGLQPYRLRVSGHYYPHEFKKILMAIKPKKLTPIHTKYPSIMRYFYATLKF